MPARTSRRFHCTDALFRVVVNLPVLGLDDLPIEMLVLDLIHTEVLLCIETSADEQHQQDQNCPNRFHCDLLLWFQRHRFRIAPQALYLIERPKRGMEDVNYKIKKIEQHPAALL